MIFILKTSQNARHSLIKRNVVKAIFLLPNKIWSHLLLVSILVSLPELTTIKDNVLTSLSPPPAERKPWRQSLWERILFVSLILNVCFFLPVVFLSISLHLPLVFIFYSFFVSSICLILLLLLTAHHVEKLYIYNVLFIY